MILGNNKHWFCIFHPGILIKLKISRKSRINDKLTKVTIDEIGIRYKLNNNLHREYNKPSYMPIILLDDKYYNTTYYYYHIYGQKLRKDGVPIIGNVYRDSNNNNDFNSPTCLVMFFRERATFVGVKTSIRYLDYETIISYYIFDR